MATTSQGVAGRLGAWYAHGLDRGALARLALVLAVGLAIAAAIGAASLRVATPVAPGPLHVVRTEESAAQPLVTALPELEQAAAPAGPRVIRSDTPIVIRSRGPRGVVRSTLPR